jgi:hypothetical protein
MALARAPVEHRAYNTNAEFANFSPSRRARHRGLDLGIEGVRGSALLSAIALTICTRKGAVPAAVIVAAAIVNMIR